MTFVGIWKHGNHILCQDVKSNGRFCPPISQGRDFTILWLLIMGNKKPGIWGFCTGIISVSFFVLRVKKFKKVKGVEWPCRHNQTTWQQRPNLFFCYFWVRSPNLQKAPISLGILDCPSVRIYQLGSQGNDFREIWHWQYGLNSDERSRFGWNQTNISVTLQEELSTFILLTAVRSIT